MFFCVTLHRNCKSTTGRKLSTAPGTRRRTPIYIIVQVREGIFIPFIIMSKKTTNCNHEGWHTNTDLGCDVKTILRSVERYALGVYNEICMALGGLIGE